MNQKNIISYSLFITKHSFLHKSDTNPHDSGQTSVQLKSNLR